MRLLAILLGLLLIVNANKVSLSFKILSALGNAQVSSDSASETLRQKLTANTLNSPYKILNWTIWSNGPTSTSVGTSSGEGEASVSPAVRLQAPFWLLTAIAWLLSSKFRFGIIVTVMLLSSQLVNGMGVYDNCKLMDSSTQYKLYWTVSGSTINFGMEASASGWIALGVSANGNMDSGGGPPGTDIALGYVDTATCQTGCLGDYSTRVYSLPSKDPTQNVQLVSANLTNGILSIEWSRQLNTGDTQNDRPITATGDNYILWALHRNTKPTNNGITFPKHTDRGSAVIDFSQISRCPGQGDIQVDMTLNVSLDNFDSELFRSSIASEIGVEISRVAIVKAIEIVDPFVCSNCQYIDFTFNNYSVPTERTTYVCLGFNFPIDVARRIIRFEPIEDNKQVLHHMVLYGLTAGAPAPSQTPENPCNMPPGAQVFYVWAPGGKPLTLPNDVGISIGPNLVEYATLQMHYDNPTGSSTFKDSSGVRVWITTDNKTNEAGYLFLGVNLPFISLPPGRASYHMSGACPLGLTKLLPHPLQIIAAMPHLHTLGVSLWTDINRNGTPAGRLADVPNYDFNDQKYYIFPGATIEAGDELVTHCVWNTVGQNTTVYGGESTNTEMCFNIIMYYPKIAGGDCIMRETRGCDCAYGENCLDKPGCNILINDCGSHRNCSTCSLDVNCHWCDSAIYQGCLPNFMSGYCPSIGGTLDNCSQRLGTVCTGLHNDCNSCNADAANRCGWCQSHYQGQSACLGLYPGYEQYSGPVCEYMLNNVWHNTTCS